MGRTKKSQPTPSSELSDCHSAPSIPQPSGTLGELAAACEDNVNKFGLSKATTKSYSIYTGGARQFLHDLIEERIKMKTKDHIPNDELAHALDKVPNCWSYYVLQLYIGQKCCTGEKKCGKSTADSIYSAWVKEWTKSSSRGYGGDYHCDSKTGKVTGCPAKAYEVKQLVKSVKARAAKRGEGTERHHAEAITIEDMQSTMRWSQTVCLDSLLENPPLGNPDILAVLDKHGLFRAFSTTAFTMFTRNFETCNMRFGDLDFTGRGPGPRYRPFIGVELSERKGWQKAAGNDGVVDQTYEIYEQPDHREIDMFTHLPRWLRYLSLRLGRPLVFGDYIFPYIAPNGVVHPNTPVSYDTVQNLLQEFVSGAGLNKVLTTHCFRRGGAQYRFMYAPVTERWSLNAIQWWGGWAVGEGVDVLLKYLVNSLHTIENTYRSALDPDRRPLADVGSNRPCEPVSQENILNLKACLTKKMEELNLVVSQKAEAPRAPTGAATAHPITSEQSPLPFEAGVSIFRAHAHFSSTGTVAQSEPVYAPHATYAPHTTTTTVTAISNLVHHQRRPRSRPQAIPGVFIPNLTAGSGAWREAVKQWEEGGVDLVPLRDWPPAWYSGDMRTAFGTKRGDRKTVAEEYERLKRDDEAFIRLYPEAEKGFRALLTAIQTRSPTHAGRRRRSKRGHPDERDSRSSSISPGEQL
ncbi:hypothetical protein DFP72DRAFT_812044 [Ephemerocybe angulata]|uniref:Uncharacterized protein n=1 Tax=Ephemerocybe angulata TaxID=980116 RepID=A0A8H6HXM3_9AGAR|nr:hypothetical protein DFP72DRAFT_812044 [Tulosesus angulatus]